MTRSSVLRVAALAAAALLAACATEERVPERRPAGIAAAATPAADLAGARRCMDTLLLDQGPRDLALLVEDGGDRSSGRELMISAISDMTQRSRAVRLVQAGKASDTEAPSLAVRARLADAGKNAVALDVALLSVRDQSVVPGTASRTSAVLAEREGRAEIRKAGVVFSVALGGGDPRAEAQRAVADLAAIELLGRATRVPYWRCVGAPANDPSVTAEVQDWYDAMAARPAEIIGFFQQGLKARRVYDGPVDGAVNPALKDAVARYREALGLSREPKLSLDFFQAWLAADHHALAAKLNPARPAPAATAVAVASPVTPAAPSTVTPLPVAAVVAAPSAPALQLRIASQNEAQRFGRGEPVQLTIQPSRDAHVYCFHQDEQRRITRFFPNRFRTSSLVTASSGMQLPGTMRFEIVMNAKGVPETVACFATETDVLARLPANLAAGDFATLPFATMDQVRSAFQKVADGTLAADSFQLRSR